MSIDFEDEIKKLKSMLAFCQTGVANPDLLHPAQAKTIDGWWGKLKAEVFKDGVLELATAKVLDSKRKTPAELQLSSIAAEALSHAEELNGDPAECPYNEPIGERLKELRIQLRKLIK